MKIQPKSIRPFIGAKDYDLSRNFYTQLGFEEVILEPKMSLFKMDDFGFYLQDYYAREWVDNAMVFLEVEDLEKVQQQFAQLKLADTFSNVRLSPIKNNDWGNEFFLHDPSGILWHIGNFTNT